MRKKILFLIHTLQVGGAERVLVDLVNNLPKEKYDITVMTVVDLGILKTQLKSHIKYKSIYSFKLLKKLSGGENKYGASNGGISAKNILKKMVIGAYVSFWRHANTKRVYKKHITENYDTEISFLEGIPAKIVADSSNKKSRKICWIHIDLINEPKSDRFFKNIKQQQEVYNKFDKIVCVSKVSREHFIKKIGIEEDKVDILYNPIDPNQIRKLSNVDKKIEKKKNTFCSVGRLASQKGYDRLIEASSRLEHEGYDFEVWIIGAGPEEQKLKDSVDKSGAKSVKFLGYQKNPYVYMSAADWFICSSRAEGFSTVMAEAIVLGKAIISTECSGVKEMLGENSEYGIVCNNDADGIYESMKKVLDDKKIQSAYEKNVKSQQKMFIMKDSIKEIEKAL